MKCRHRVASRNLGSTIFANVEPGSVEIVDGDIGRAQRMRRAQRWQDWASDCPSDSGALSR